MLGLVKIRYIDMERHTINVILFHELSSWTNKEEG